MGQVGTLLTWGGALSLNPADDVLIRMERALDVDNDAQLMASTLSRRIAAGSTHVLIDMSVGSTVKVRSVEDLERLEMLFKRVAQAFGAQILIVRVGGMQPVSHEINPALEAKDVLAVLQRTPTAPFDLRERSLLPAGALLEFCGTAIAGTGLVMATDLLDSGTTRWKFGAICETQGGLRIPREAAFRRDVAVEQNDIVTHIDNRHLARIAKLTGTPVRQVVGIQMHVWLRDQANVGQPPFTIHTQTSGELEYSSAYTLTHVAVGLFPIGVGWYRAVSAYPLAVQRGWTDEHMNTG